MREQVSKSNFVDVGTLVPISRQGADDLRIVGNAFAIQEFDGADGGQKLADAREVHPSVFRPSFAKIGRRLSPVPDADVDERAVLTDVKDITGHVVLEGIPDRETELSEVRSRGPAPTLSAAYWHLVANLAFRIHFFHPYVLRVLRSDHVRTCFSDRDAFRGTTALGLSRTSAGYHKFSPSQGWFY